GLSNAFQKWPFPVDDPGSGPDGINAPSPRPSPPRRAGICGFFLVSSLIATLPDCAVSRETSSTLDQFSCRGRIRLGPAGPWVIAHHRHAETRGLTHLDASRNDRAHHDGAEMLPHIVH